MKSWVLERKQECIAVLLLLVFVAPLFILGGNSHIRIHDNLDSNMTWYRVLLNSGNYLAKTGTNIPQMLDGFAPRDAFDSQFVGIVWLYAIFPTPLAFAVSQLITRVFAFIGMRLWLRDYVIKDPKQKYITIFVALAFALTPFWPSGMLSTLGMPLALWAFLNIRKGKKSIWNWLILTLLPFYSSLILGFCFFLFLVACIWVYDIVKKRGWNWRFFGSMVYMSVLYCIVNYRFISQMFFQSNEPDSRSTFSLPNNSFLDSIRLTFKNFTIGHTHDQSLATYVVLPVILLALIVMLVKKDWRGQKLFLWLLALNFALSVWYAFWWWGAWNPVKEQISIMRSFNFSRFHFLQPFIYYGLFALALVYFAKKGGGWKKLAIIGLILQIGVTFANNAEILYREAGTPSINQFYAKDEFQQIKDYIGKLQKDYRVASIGIHPSISQENGFYTLDGYVNSYPLSYKAKFREIIAPELAKSPTLREYYDGWGNRVYIFVAELGKNYLFDKNSTKHIKNLELNTQAFKEMGGEYIFSALPIDNAAANHLYLEKVFDDKQAAWKIYLYKAE
ncbi:DUF6044 family protein [Listeria booriae]|uniref:DUF6044 family protein n=1 Tax=Listeria booriae TaxID=1552123 RepID=UPI001624279B|nr:DUF6044 family protein [Listeria booriae]MBC1513200.1 hypothetical protein [Listeria booriae]MBC6152041.1 hypothetical protein [Listeria booriae]MBC6306208.1 hypothetical protein [Listeria booriae]